MSEREVATAEDIFIDSSEQEHTIELGNNKVIKISLREPTWQNYTDAMRAFTKIDARTQKVSADYGAYYHSLLRSILAKSEPSFSADDLFRVKAEVGAIGTANYTIAGWFNTDASNQQVYFTTGPNAANGGSNDNLFISIDPGGGYLGLGSAVAWKHQASTTITQDVWHQFILTRVGTVSKWYLDGVLVGTGTDSTTWTASTLGYLGQNGGGTQDFNGEMKDVRIYDYGLSDDQAASLYSGTYPQTPDHWWKIDEGSGVTATIEDYGTGTDADGTGVSLGTWVNGTLDLDGDLTVAANGTLSAPKGNLELGAEYHNFVSGSTFTHNNGTYVQNKSGGTSRFNNSNSGNTSVAFYNYTINGNTSKFYTGCTFENALTVTSGTAAFMCDSAGSTANATWTLGTTSNQATLSIASSQGTRFQKNRNAESGEFTGTLQGASSLYPAIISGAGVFDWDYQPDVSSAGQGEIQLKNVDVQFAVTIGGGGGTNKITLTGDCEFDDFTVGSGDELDINGKRMECSGTLSVSGTIDYGGGLVVAGRLDLGGTQTNEEGTNFITNGASSPVHNINPSTFVGDTNTNILFNSTSDVSSTHGSFAGNIIIGSGKVDSKGGTLTCTDLTVATGATWDPENDTIDLNGDLTMSGGLIGKSAGVLDGTDDYFRETTAYGTNSNLKGWTDAVTVDVWFKSAGTMSGDQILASQWASSQKPWILYVQSNGDIRWAVNGDGAGEFVNTGVDQGIDDQKWHHICGTYDKTDLRLYLDGKLIGVQAQTTALQNSTDNTIFAIGAYNTNDSNTHSVSAELTGTVAKCSVWNAALTPAQIRKQMLYDYTALAADDTNFDDTLMGKLKGWWQFDEGIDSSVDNAQGTANADLLRTGATWAGAPTFDAESEGSGTYSIHKFSKGSGTQYIYGINGTRLDSVEITSGSTVKFESLNDTGGELKIYGVLTATGTLASGVTAGNSKVSFWTGGLTHVVGSAANSLSGLYALEMSHGSGTVTMPAMTVKRFIQEGAGTTELAGALTVGSSTRSAGAAAINDLTVSAGKLDVGSSGENITCTNDILISGGELDADATSSDGNVTAQSITLSGGIFNAPSHGTITVTSQNVGGWCFYHTGGTFNANLGTIKVDFGVAGAGHFNPHQPHNVIIEMYNSASSTVWRDHTGNTMSISGDLTIVEGFFKGDNSTDTLTVTKGVIIEDAGTLGQTSDTRANNFGSLTVENNGTYNATSGTTSITGGASVTANRCVKMSTNAVFNHNDGTLNITGTDWGGSAYAHLWVPDNFNFGNVTINAGGADSKYYQFREGSGTMFFNDVYLKSGEFRDYNNNNLIHIRGDLDIGTRGAGGTNASFLGSDARDNAYTTKVIVEGLVTNYTNGQFHVAYGTDGTDGCKIGGLRNTGGTVYGDTA